MTRTDTLRRQHDQILEKAITVQDLARALDEPGRVNELMAELRWLDAVLTDHLATEDRELYPEMIASGNAQASATADRFRAEMGGLSADYRSFSEEWFDEARIASDPLGFRAGFTKIVFALSKRIHRENNELYPLADTMDQECESEGEELIKRFG